MSKHMTIINLACTITKVRKWGEGWKHSAESAHAAFAELHRKHKEAERIIETLRANLTQTEAESRVESLRLKAELAVVKDERNELRAKCDSFTKERDGLMIQSTMSGPTVATSICSCTKCVRSFGQAWSDVPNATQWVEDMRGNTEASHDTPAGKEAAEAVVRDSQMTDTHDCGPNCPHCSW